MRGQHHESWSDHESQDSRSRCLLVGGEYFFFLYNVSGHHTRVHHRDTFSTHQRQNESEGIKEKEREADRYTHAGCEREEKMEKAPQRQRLTRTTHQAL